MMTAIKKPYFWIWVSMSLTINLITNFTTKAVRFPFADSNIQIKIIYNTISTKVLIIFRASSKYPTFKKHSIEFIKHMGEQVAKLNRMNTSKDR